MYWSIVASLECFAVPLFLDKQGKWTENPEQMERFTSAKDAAEALSAVATETLLGAEITFTTWIRDRYANLPYRTGWNKGKPKTRIRFGCVNRRKLYQSLEIPVDKIPGPDYTDRRIHVPIHDGWEQDSAPRFYVPVEVRKQTSKGRNPSAHRIFLQCPQCYDMVTAGRFGMHYTTLRCDRIATEKGLPLHKPEGEG